MAAEETICRKCGMNTATGQMDVKEAKKRARKGADPALFYAAAWSDSWAFLQQYWRLGLKTSLVWTTFLTIVLTCASLPAPGSSPVKSRRPRRLRCKWKVKQPRARSRLGGLPGSFSGRGLAW